MEQPQTADSYFFDIPEDGGIWVKLGGDYLTTKGTHSYHTEREPHILYGCS